MSNAPSPSSPVKMLFAPPAVAIEEFLLGHRKWIEAVIECPVAEAITFEFHLPFDELVLNNLFADLPLDRRSVSYAAALQPVVAKWEMPPDMSPRIELSMSRNRDAGVAKGKFGWEPEWKGTPLAIWLKGCVHALVYATVPYMSHTADGRSSSRSLLIVNRREMAAVLRILEAIEPPRKITMIGGRDVLLPADGYGWDSVVLNSELERFVRDDFESFFQREEWFRQHRLPYRRGYLFYGPPGNGKTSVARVMACHPAIRAFGIDFRASKDAPYSADQLGDLFCAAASQAPSLVILEDIDKVGAGEPETLRHTINGLLSCMDGLTTEDGVIVVATANDPTSLSNALLKRPGRFDRVARFSTPSVDLRRRYLTHMSGGNFDEAEATAAALALDRFSFAQIREAYILAGQFAFNCGSEITANDMARAAKQLRQEGQRINRHTENGGVGFSIVDDQVSVS